MPIPITEVKIEDHSRLGGPMGTETTSTIESKLFFDKEEAIDWAVKYVQRKYPEAYKQYATGKNPREQRAALIRNWGDLGPIGVMFDRRSVN